jgi:hypothetical protein
MRIKAVPTVYRGIRMRSRLEARWAAFFDLCNWRWRYEPYLLPGWLPDFELKMFGSAFPTVLVEVKPICFFGDPSFWGAELDHPEIAKIHGHYKDVVVLGSGPSSDTDIGEPFPSLGVWLAADTRRPTAFVEVFGCDYWRLMPGRSGDKDAWEPYPGLIRSRWEQTLAMTRTEKVARQAPGDFWEG